jgi:putative transposase
MSTYKNKYRIESTRLQNWDYGWVGSYFVTATTEDRKHFFGEVLNDEVDHTEIGTIATQEWLKTLEIRPNMKLHLGEFVVMPDHFHAIITIGSNQFNEKTSEMTPEEIKRAKKFGPQKNNLSSIMRGFKSTVTTQGRLVDKAFGWQERFYDRVIRTWKEYEAYSEYIRNNPKNWKRNLLKELLQKKF